MARERKFSTDELYRAAKQLLFEYGYEGFTFSLLAERLNVSRGAIYKYFENKEELLTEYMSFEMDTFLRELKKVKEKQGFLEQFDYILQLIFDNSDIHQIITMGEFIPENLTNKAKENRQKLERQHFEMYSLLQSVIRLGKNEQKLKGNLPDSVILGFIFMSIAIPNHARVPKAEWIASIKETLKYGMFAESN